MDYRNISDFRQIVEKKKQKFKIDKSFHLNFKVKLF